MEQLCVVARMWSRNSAMIGVYCTCMVTFCHDKALSIKLIFVIKYFHHTLQLCPVKTKGIQPLSMA